MIGRMLRNAVHQATQRQTWLDFERMPAELEQGRLVLSESLISTLLPVPLKGRPDAVYRSRGGLLVPVETKVRSCPMVRVRDIVQLSVYRVILEGSPLAGHTDAPVADYGYVRLVVNGRPVYCQVPLFDKVMVTLLWAAFWRCRA